MRQGNLQRVWSSFLGSRDSQNYNQPQVWDWTKAAEFLWDLCAQELSSATKSLTAGNLLTPDQ